MKKPQVKIGQTYLCKVGRNLTEVRIDGESRHGGWDATNVKTRRKVRIKSAQRLRAPARQEAPGAKKAAKTPKAARGRNPAQPGAPKAKKTSLLEAAVQILSESAEPMNTKAIVAEVLGQGLWNSPGKTPDATLYASILREMRKKGKAARFRKATRGHFALTS